MSETRLERALAIQTVLNRIYPDPPIPLQHTDAYTLLIAVLLSAQCTDKRVNQVTPFLFKKASNPEAMAKLSVAAIRQIIKPCGLSPSKSKNIRELSVILTRRYGGKVPCTFAELEALPGVGHKTASVVMAQAFGHPAFPVDTHIHRLAYRWKLSSGRSVEQTERDLKRLFPREAWIRLHLQFIYYGREYCPARGHLMSRCEICAKFARKHSWR